MMVKNEFYQGLNLDRNEERWIAWEGHRSEINEFIEKSLCKDGKAETAIVLGAGNCDDLDLQFLSQLFGSITLADIDGDATERAVLAIDNERIKNQIHVMKNIDFTKLDQIDFYHLFEQMLVQKVSSNEIAAFLISSGNEMDSCSLLRDFHKGYSVVISSAVYTQVFYIHALTIFAKYADLYSEQEVNQIVKGLVQLRDKIIKDYNDLLIFLVKDSGRIIVWTDVLRLDSSMEAIIVELYEFRMDKDRFNYLLKIIAQFGREAAIVGLQDLQGKLSETPYLQRFWNWPFNDEKQYLTIGLSGNPKRPLLNNRHQID
ncbi:hypothetical protein EHS13_17880 [Paenibacillus psychroresistens]|uniref:Histidine-specific methyltransferase SAM-dependent domain-containing protein n=1 Tax=Paenibacillus psychroresistens TaxID=1778678 RepID=A0A6B8RLT5_9BACL|nr:hypothetical protein [Paenibacillus psychroresistens]QGQ96612.1 hypothetical protein EHS13_17880 [Paenibacillus psychroresistens]